MNINVITMLFVYAVLLHGGLKGGDTSYYAPIPKVGGYVPRSPCSLCILWVHKL